LKPNIKEIESPKGWYSHGDAALTSFNIKNEVTDEIKAVVEKQTIINYEDHQMKCYIKDKLLTDENMGISKMKFNQDMSYNIQNVLCILNMHV